MEFKIFNKNGGAVATTDAPLANTAYPHDFIPFSPTTKENNFLKFASLYEQRLTLSEIERQTGFARNTIRDALTSGGVPLRKKITDTKTPLSSPVRQRSGVPAYGYVYHNGETIPAPEEYKIVIKIYRLWQKGENYSAIARHLDSKKIPTRNGGKWTHELIKRIINRHEGDLKKEK